MALKWHFHRTEEYRRRLAPHTSAAAWPRPSGNCRLCAALNVDGCSLNALYNSCMSSSLPSRSRRSSRVYVIAAHRIHATCSTGARSAEGANAHSRRMADAARGACKIRVTRRAVVCGRAAVVPTLMQSTSERMEHTLIVIIWQVAVGIRRFLRHNAANEDP
ncbi:hypothetical protein DFH06DRAFT_1177383 [Mycena polygramma]|nr:hypothetical protein DFH06DRAFT_1177383 [Mycena polygramma]